MMPDELDERVAVEIRRIVEPAVPPMTGAQVRERTLRHPSVPHRSPGSERRRRVPVALGLAGVVIVAATSLVVVLEPDEDRAVDLRVETPVPDPSPTATTETVPAPTSSPTEGSGDDLDAVEVATDSWSISAPPPIDAGRFGDAVAWTGAELVLWGGDRISDGVAYDPVTDTWRVIADSP